MLGHRNLVRIAVDRRRRREDEAINAAFHRRVEQAACRHGVVAVIAERIAHRVGHHDRAREVNDGLDAVPFDHAFDEVLVAGVADGQRNAFGEESRKTGGEVVDHDDAFAGVRQRMNHVTSDITGAAGDKHGHDLT